MLTPFAPKPNVFCLQGTAYGSAPVPSRRQLCESLINSALCCKDDYMCSWCAVAWHAGRVSTPRGQYTTSWCCILPNVSVSGMVFDAPSFPRFICPFSGAAVDEGCLDRVVREVGELHDDSKSGRKKDTSLSSAIMHPAEADRWPPVPSLSPNWSELMTSFLVSC